jgi:hypothetical protein
MSLWLKILWMRYPSVTQSIWWVIYPLLVLAGAALAILIPAFISVTFQRFAGWSFDETAPIYFGVKNLMQLGAFAYVINGYFIRKR